MSTRAPTKEHFLLKKKHQKPHEAVCEMQQKRIVEAIQAPCRRSPDRTWLMINQSLYCQFAECICRYVRATQTQRPALLKRREARGARSERRERRNGNSRFFAAFLCAFSLVLAAFLPNTKELRKIAHNLPELRWKAFDGGPALTTTTFAVSCLKTSPIRLYDDDDCCCA